MQPAAFAGMDQALRKVINLSFSLHHSPGSTDGRCARTAPGHAGGSFPPRFLRSEAEVAFLALRSVHGRSCRAFPSGPLNPSRRRAGRAGLCRAWALHGFAWLRMFALQVPAIECPLTCYSACHQAPSFSPLPKPSCHFTFRLSGVGSCRSRASFKGCLGGRQL